MSVWTASSWPLARQPKTATPTDPKQKLGGGPGHGNRQIIAMVLTVIVAITLSLQIRANKLAKAAARQQHQMLAVANHPMGAAPTAGMASKTSLARFARTAQPYTVGFSFLATCASLGLCWRQMT